MHRMKSIMAKKENRFEVIYKDGSQLSDEGYRQILVDKHTGVNYLPYLSHLFGQMAFYL